MLREKMRAIRPGKPVPFKPAAAVTAALFCGGGALGTLAKWLDTRALNSDVWWHRPIEKLALGQFFSDMAVWLLAALLIVVFSRSAGRAALNVFGFFAGMCLAYHACTLWLAGFDPGSYMLIWYSVTAVSPLLAVGCWYARGDGPVAVTLCVLIMAGFTLACFAVGWLYVEYRGILYVLAFAGAAGALYKSPLRLLTVPAGVALAVLVSPLLPFAL